jgi:predicted HicB family RNase H-like nuclease
MAQSRAHIEATTRFEHKTYDKITVRLRKDGELTRELVAQAASEAGESVNEYVINAIRERMNGGSKLPGIEEITREPFFE